MSVYTIHCCSLFPHSLLKLVILFYSQLNNKVKRIISDARYHGDLIFAVHLLNWVTNLYCFEFTNGLSFPMLDYGYTCIFMLKLTHHFLLEMECVCIELCCVGSGATLSCINSILVGVDFLLGFS